MISNTLMESGTGTTPITKKMVVLDVKEQTEPLLAHNNKRFVLFPIQYDNVQFLILTPDLEGVQECRS